MLLIPIAQEHSEIRRFPWVSAAIIGLNVLVSLVILLGDDAAARARDIEERGRAVEDYLAEHPYLNIPRALAERLSPQLRAEMEQERREAEQRLRLQDVDVSARQAELDALGDRLVEAIEGTPWHRYGFVPARRRPASVLTSMFVHGGWLHLFGNMLLFFLSGPFVEDRFGRPLFAALYLLSGEAAAAAHGLRFPESTLPMVGASGALAGVMGAFLVRLGLRRIKFLVLPIPIIPTIRFTMFLPAFLIIPLWLAQQVFYAHADPAASGVAWWAHIGGFAFGFAAAGLVRLMRIEERWIHPAIEKKIGITQHPSLELASEARVRGELSTARAEVRKVLAADPHNVEGCLEAYEVALAGGDAEEIGRAALRLTDAYAKAGEKELAVRVVDEVLSSRRRGLSARLYLTAGSLLEREGRKDEALQAYQRVLDECPADPAAFRAWFRRGEILRRGGDARGARAAYERAREHPGCVEEWARTVEQAMARLPPDAGRR